LQGSCNLKYAKRLDTFGKHLTPGPVFTKLFRIKIKIRLKLKNLLLWIVFKTYHNYLTIDCLCLIKYVLQTRLLSFFMKEKVKLIVATVIEI